MEMASKGSSRGTRTPDAEMVTTPPLFERPTLAPARSDLMVWAVAVLLISGMAPGDRTPTTDCALSFQ